MNMVRDHAMMAEYILTIQQPCPRDERYHPVGPSYECFNIYKCSPSNYLIVDRATGFSIKIAKTHLANPHFDIWGWYARR